MRAPSIPQGWPFRASSVHVRSGPHLWHVQDIGAGPTILLIHGAGGATHSFRHLVPLLRADFRLLALDLPGQGFSVSDNRSRCNLDDMAADIAALAVQENWPTLAAIGHSAGAAVALRLAEIADLRAVVGLNAALGKFDGVAGWLFPALANILSRLPFVPQVFSRLAGTPHQVRQLLASTGSHIDAAGEAQYLQLLRNPAHVEATLAMMAQWNLSGLLQRLSRQTTPCLLITAEGDKAVPPAMSARAAAAIPKARWVNLPGFGHLVHEESPDQVARMIRDFLSDPTIGKPT